MPPTVRSSASHSERSTRRSERFSSRADDAQRRSGSRTNDSKNSRHRRSTVTQIAPFDAAAPPAKAPAAPSPHRMSPRRASVQAGQDEWRHMGGFPLLWSADTKHRPSVERPRLTDPKTGKTTARLGDVRGPWNGPVRTCYNPQRAIPESDPVVFEDAPPKRPPLQPSDPPPFQRPAGAEGAEWEMFTAAGWKNVGKERMKNAKEFPDWT